jgi:hypothetical protein
MRVCSFMGFGFVNRVSWADNFAAVRPEPVVSRLVDVLMEKSRRLQQVHCSDGWWTFNPRPERADNR